jgi:hypothetical protein
METFTLSRKELQRPARGALVQIDGSPFAWLETPGPTFMLLGAIDDATGEILALHFRPTEDVHGYTALFQHLFTTHGLPLPCTATGSICSSATTRIGRWTNKLAGRQAPTHLGRVLQDLGIGYIAARSPQAKGRIERLWGHPARSARHDTGMPELGRRKGRGHT